MANRKVHALLGPPSVNIGRIEGGIGATSVANDCRMEVCFTYHPEDEPLLLAETDAIVAEWRARQNQRSRSRSANCTTSDPLRRNPCSIRSSPSPALSAGSELAREAFPAGSDGRLISRLLKCPTVIFGPGDIDRIHKPNEAVELAQVLAHAEALEKFLSTSR